MNSEKNTFEYSYYSPTEQERKQIESIRKQYIKNPEKNESKLDRLKKLNSKVISTATMVALIFGIVGCLIFGLGLTMVLEWNLFLWGIIVMLVGAFPMSIAYPLYNFTLKKGKFKYGEEILKLSEELLSEK